MFPAKKLAAYFLPVEFGGSIVSFHLLFGPDWQCFCWCKLQEIWWSPVYVMGNQFHWIRGPYVDFFPLDNPISTFGFCCDGSRAMPSNFLDAVWWITFLISSKSLLCEWMLQPFAFSEIQANCIVTLLVFSLEHALLIVNLLIIMSFAIWLSWELLKSSIPCSSLLTSLLSIPLFPFYYKQQEETGHIFDKLFGNLLSQISIFHPLQVLLST